MYPLAGPELVSSLSIRRVWLTRRTSEVEYHCCFHCGSLHGAPQVEDRRWARVDCARPGFENTRHLLVDRSFLSAVWRAVYGPSKCLLAWRLARQILVSMRMSSGCFWDSSVRHLFVNLWRDLIPSSAVPAAFLSEKSSGRRLNDQDAVTGEAARDFVPLQCDRWPKSSDIVAIACVRPV